MGRVARQATWITVLTTVGMALGFVNMALLFPRYLLAEEFGLTRLVVSIAVVAAQLASFGAEGTVIRYFPYFRDEARGHRGLFGAVLLIGTAGALVAMFVLGLFHGAFSRWFQNDGGLYAERGLVVLPLVLAEVYFVLLRGFSRSVHRSIAPVFAREFLLRVLQTGLIAVHIAWRMPFEVFMSLYTGTFAITTLVLAFDLWRAGKLKLGLGNARLPKRMVRSMVRYSAFTFGSGLASIAVGNIDQVMIGAMLHDGLSYVAYYAVALFLGSLIMVPARALVQPTLPILADAWRRRDHGHIAMIYHRTASIQLVAAAFIFLCLWASIDPLFSFLQPAYSIGKPVLLILGITNVINLSSGLSGGIVSTSRSYWFDAVSGFLLLGLNVLLDYVFILQWGMVGAAWSTLVSVLIVLGWRIAFLHRRYGLWPYDGKTVLALLAMIAVGAVLWYIPHVQARGVDIALRTTLVAALFWPLVHWLRIAPELGAQAGKLWRRAWPASSAS